MLKNIIINSLFFISIMTTYSCSKEIVGGAGRIYRGENNSVTVEVRGVKVKQSGFGQEQYSIPKNCNFNGGRAADVDRGCIGSECESVRVQSQRNGTEPSLKIAGVLYTHTFQDACINCNFVSTFVCDTPNDPMMRTQVQRLTLNDVSNDSTDNDDTAVITLEAPSNLAISASTSNSLSLTWDDNSDDEDGFKLERSGDGGVTWLEILSSSADLTSYTDNGGLFSSANYDYRVKAFNSERESAYSNTVTGMTDAMPPAPPSGLMTFVINANQINLNWFDNGEEGFEVFRSTTMGGPYTSLGTVGPMMTTYFDTTVVGATTYYYVLQATSATAPNSANSTEATGTTP